MAMFLAKAQKWGIYLNGVKPPLTVGKAPLRQWLAVEYMCLGFS